MSSGHIAVVEEVKQDANGWRIRISEGNYGTNGSGPWEGYNSRWLTQKQFGWRRQRVLPEEKLEELAAVSRILAAPPTDAWECYPKDASQPCHPSPTA